MTPMEAKTYVEALQKMFPKPISEQFAKGTADEYCTGAAVVQSINWKRRFFGKVWRFLGISNYAMSFPDEQTLADALMTLNDDFTFNDQQALLFAKAITSANDVGDYQLAWTTTEKALCYPQGDSNDSHGKPALLPRDDGPNDTSATADIGETPTLPRHRLRQALAAMAY